MRRRVDRRPSEPGLYRVKKANAGAPSRMPPRDERDLLLAQFMLRMMYLNGLFGLPEATNEPDFWFATPSALPFETSV